MLLVVAAGVGVFLWQRQQNDDELANLRQQLQAAQNTLQSQNIVGTEPLTTDVKMCDPAIVHEPLGVFSSSSRAELANKLFYPLRDYFAEQRQCPASINIKYAAGDTEYLVYVIFGHDSYTVFSFGDPMSSTQAWWFPECEDNQCQFSDSFKSKYPEVVEAAKN